jgi:TPR repeat protein
MRGRALKLLATSVASLTLGAALLAAEPVPVPKPESKVDDALTFPRQLDPAEALAKGRELRQRVGKGDAQAAYEFGVMLTTYGRFGPSADASTVAEWSKLANDRSALDWIMLAAEAGNPDAIGAVCRVAQDPLAPAHFQEKGKARCEGLRRKYPAK